MKKFSYRLCPLLFMAFFILLSVFVTANTKSFYSKQYLKNDATKYTGVSYPQLDEITGLLLDYLNGKTDSLDMQCNKNGVQTEVFDEREKTHMVDVKLLYKRAMVAMYAFAIGGVILGFLLYKKDGKGLFLKNIWGAYKFSFVVLAGLCISLGLLFTLGFDWFWTNFHLVFFTNDLWLLDPEVSTMINMFPLEFFLAMCSRILFSFVAVYLAFIPVLMPKGLAEKLAIKSNEA